MKFVSMVAAACGLASVQALFGSASDTTAKHIDKSDDMIDTINGYRSNNMGDAALANLSASDEMKTVLNAIVDTYVTGGCASFAVVPGAATYDECTYTLKDSESVTKAADYWYGELANYKCEYPPTETSVKEPGVANFTAMMNTDGVNFACAVTNGCATSEVVYCHFAPKFAGTAQTPFEKTTWTAIIARDNICSGEYFNQYAGIFSALAGLTVAYSYVAA